MNDSRAASGADAPGCFLVFGMQVAQAGRAPAPSSVACQQFSKNLTIRHHAGHRLLNPYHVLHCSLLYGNVRGQTAHARLPRTVEAGGTPGWSCARGRGRSPCTQVKSAGPEDWVLKQREGGARQERRRQNIWSCRERQERGLHTSMVERARTIEFDRHRNEETVFNYASRRRALMTPSTGVWKVPAALAGGPRGHPCRRPSAAGRGTPKSRAGRARKQ